MASVEASSAGWPARSARLTTGSGAGRNVARSATPARSNRTRYGPSSFNESSAQIMNSRLVPSA